MIKNLTSLCNIDDTKALQVRVRRNHTFDDFCVKFSQSWVRQKVGSAIVISFIGESGIDQGGLRQVCLL